MKLPIRIVSLVAGGGLCVALLAGGVTQEVPRGRLAGVVVMSESNKPLPKASVTLMTKHELGPDEKEYRTFETDADGRFELKNIPAGLYSIRADGKAHSSKEQLITIDESETTDLSISLKPAQPYLELYASQRVFTPGSAPSFTLSGFEPAKTAKVEYFKLDLEKIALNKGLKTLLYSFSRPGTGTGTGPAAASTETKDFDKNIGSKDIEGVFNEPIDMPKLAEGFYYVRCTVGKLNRATFLNVSKIGLVTKSVENKSLCYVADIESGKPISGAQIQTLQGSTLVTAGVTANDGTFTTKISSKNDLVVAKQGQSLGVVDVELYGDSGSKKTKIVMYTDRPIYRPGDQVQFKGIIRNFNGGGYSVPGAGSAKVEVLDSNENPITTLTVPVSARGSFHGSYTSNREDAPGSYSFHIKYGDADYNYWFNLAAYRKPDFSIKIDSTKDYFLFGDTASAKVKCEYYFGGPVVGAKVEAYISRTQKYQPYEGEDEAPYEDYEGDYYPSNGIGDYTQTINVVTDEKGEATISFPTKTDGDVGAPSSDYTYNVNASVTDSSGKYFDGQGAVTVVRGDIDVQLELNDYVVASNSTTNAIVEVTDQATDRPIPDQEVAVEFGTETWKGNEAIFTSRGVLKGKTDSRGVATIAVDTGRLGSLVLKASAQDRSGRSVTQESYLYVEGENAVGPPTAHFTVTLNKRRYKIGDNCEALIQTDQKGGSALVTIEGDQIISQQVLQLDKAAVTVKFPVTAAFAPNVTVSVCAIKNRKLAQADSRLIVNIPEHKLNVEVQSDRPDYRPGETATITVKTTDNNGRGAPSEVSIGVVDESIYALKEDSTNLERELYPMRGNGVSTGYSFEEIYLDGGDKGGGNIPIRSIFKDTADWQPIVQTDEEGVARVTVKLPDNLTTWRATAVAVSDRTQVGKGISKFRVNKPIMARLALPAFLVEGDKQVISASITNDTGKDQQVNVRLDAQGVNLDGTQAQTITVQAEKPSTLTWNIEAPNAGTARFTVYATVNDGPNDAEDRSIEVKPHGLEAVDLQSGETNSSKDLTFEVSPDAAQIGGRLRLTFAPTIASSIYQSLDRFIDFPYGCVEQTMSRFLPTVVLSETLDKAKISNPELKAKIPAIVADGYARLAAMKHSDGAWGWWTYDESDAFMTAYVLDGLQRAEKAGYPTEKIDVDSALAWVKTRLTTVGTKPEDRFNELYLAYIAAKNGLKDEARAALKKIGTPSGSAEYALFALAANQVNDSALATATIARLHNVLESPDSKIRLGTSSGYYGAESLALPLLAYVEVAPKDTATASSLAQKLMAARRSDFWYSTRDSSFAIIALTEFLKSTNELGTTFDLNVDLNGKTIKKISFTPESILSADQKVEIPLAELEKGTNRLALSVAGTGKCYYSLDLKQVVRHKAIQPASSTGLTISREYFRLEPQRMEDGNQRLMPSKRPVTEVNAGDLIQVQLHVYSSGEREFMMIEDPVPSNCRVTDREYVENPYEWTFWWSQLIIRDDKVAFFMRRLPTGKGTLTYTMRAEQTGNVSSLPATIANMYDPTQSAHGASSRFEVAR